MNATASRCSSVFTLRVLFFLQQVRQTSGQDRDYLLMRYDTDLQGLP